MSAHRADMPRLALDLVVAAVIAGLVLALDPGLGVIAAFGVPILVLGLVWIALERTLQRRRRGRPRRLR